MWEQAIYKEKVDTKIKKPNLYRVVLLNDDYSTMDFVVEVLIKVFHKSITEATRIMLDVHEKGRGIVGVYTYDIAYTKVAQVEEMANERQFPLQAVMEEV
ncbi:MAG: ATP-dependent Clp protease adapter ClpS [Clostridia bacterium]|nr:ATP-dependent Clp protease adapter ClpS [Clostridia bacterium]